MGPERSGLAGVPLLLCQLTLAIGYGFSGVTKIAVSGFEWANGYTLMGILVRYDNVWSAAVTQSPELCQLLSVGALVTQGTFPLVLLLPFLRAGTTCRRRWPSTSPPGRPWTRGPT